MAPWKRKGRKTYGFQGLTRTGYVQLTTGSRDKGMARRMEGMWESLAREERAWDILDLVTAGPMSVAQLYDLWTDARRDVTTLRRMLNDSDLVPLIPAWLAEYRDQVEPDTAQHAETHVKWLLGDSRLASQATPDWLAQRLAEYPGKRNTKRKVHSHWSMFFGWLAARGKLRPNPMLEVGRPAPKYHLVRFHELPEVRRIVDHQPTPERRGLLAMSYGGAAEITPLLRVQRSDVDLASRSIRLAGTKARTRDRIIRIADWAWPYVMTLCKGKLPTAPLVPETLTRWTVSDWHRESQKALKLPVLPLKNARHHWAVMRLRAGVPVAVVQAQLGHSSPNLTLRTYGPFIPDGADREAWERVAAKDMKRRAKG